HSRGFAQLAHLLVVRVGDECDLLLPAHLPQVGVIGLIDHTAGDHHGNVGACGIDQVVDALVRHDAADLHDSALPRAGAIRKPGKVDPALDHHGPRPDQFRKDASREVRDQDEPPYVAVELQPEDRAAASAADI